MTMQQSTVFLVDDDFSVLDSCSVLLRSMNLQVETYSSGLEFLERYDPSRPGCLVMDVRMPLMSGPEVQAKLAKSEPRIPVVFLTAYVDMRIAVNAMKQGAEGFLEKGASDAELLMTIQRALRIDQENRQKLIRRRHFDARMNRVSPAEKDVLKGVLAGQSNKMICAHLGVSRRCVEDRRASVMAKLEVESVPELVRMICEHEHELN